MLCGIFIISCGKTGNYFTLTGFDHSPDNALPGVLLIIGSSISGWAQRIEEGTKTKDDCSCAARGLVPARNMHSDLVDFLHFLIDYSTNLRSEFSQFTNNIFFHDCGNFVKFYYRINF